MPKANRSDQAPGPTPTITLNGLSVVGLFAGIGGIELGLESHGHQSALLCEIEPRAQAVLRHRFPGTEIVGDVRQLRALPRADLSVSPTESAARTSTRGRSGFPGDDSG